MQFGGPQLSGKTPAQFSQLPTGEYQLTAWRGDYVKESKLEIKTAETNRQTVVFEYGEVKFLTKPDGVAVFDSSKELGKTPKGVSELKPGQYRFRLQLEGYHPVDLSIRIQGKDAIVISTNLVNRRYGLAMDDARRKFGSGLPDYRGALAAVEEALQAQPEDREASGLKMQIETALREHEKRTAETRATEEKRKAEEAARKAVVDAAETRLRVAEENFKKAIEGQPHLDLFDLHIWKAKSGFAPVREAVLRYVQKGPDQWKLATNEFRIDEKLSVFELFPKGFFADKKAAYVQICEMPSGETEIRCKIWLYTVTNPLEGFVPVTEKLQRPSDPNYGKNWRERITRQLKQNLEKELGKEIK